MKTPLIAVGCAAATAALLYFGTGLHPVPLLTWLAALPVLWAAPRLPWWGALLVALVAGAAGATNLWSYFMRDLATPVPLAAGLVLLTGVTLGLSTMAFRALVLAERPVAAALAVPAVWVTVEWLVSLGLPHGAWWSLAYTQSSWSIVRQAAAFGGVWAVSFLLLLTPAALAAARRSTVTLLAVVLVTAAGLGLARLATAPAGPTVRVGLLAVGQPADPVRLDSPSGPPLLDAYVTEARNLARRGATTIVLPENVLRLPEERLEQLTGPLSELARSEHVTVVFGASIGSANTAVVIEPDGRLQRYVKQHLVPGLEDHLTPGHERALLAADPRIGVLICKDLDFPSAVRPYRGDGARLLAAPAWDFVRDGWLHSRIAAMRGVESGLAIARTARSGRLTVSDSRGTVLAEADYRPDGVASLVVDVPLAPVSTVYGGIGDLFAWLCAAAAALLAALAVRTAGRRPGPPLG
ncbi:nitrilase-related carbon-nitrogen hydrolase [Catellatospora sp. KI3]|uniref:nitrilase-related carbon-nitrogen hydrolase n=1 Tax=Catellatospora sp. KI3 TaxID=3041620 RepID=UPI0024829FAD|nr:nitrilase-related carbon-nitrogen hydrolase [Catellatospora sp. KI3]MDI1463534.1 nitrilase-related carbon-nitrogen hydrolase [Catellatospora sp. KI3]